MSRIGTIVVGAGHLGRIHTRLAKGLAEFDLLGVVDPIPETRQRIHDEFGVATFASLAELPVRPEAAIVAAPSPLHHRIGLQLLERGIHVLMEKPIAVDSRQARELVDVARRQDRVLQVGHVERFNPAFRALQSRLSRAKFVRTRRLSEYTFRSTDVGVVLDLMIHDIDLVLTLVDAPVTKVDAVGVSIMGEYEDLAHVRLEFENGSVAELEASRCSFVKERSLMAFSDRGFASADFTTRNVRSIVPDPELLSRAVPFLQLGATQRDEVRRDLFSKWLPVHDEIAPETNAILDEQRDFARAIRTDHRPLVDGVAGAAALEVAERILDAIGRHAWHGTGHPSRGPLAMPLPRLLGMPHPALSSDEHPAVSEPMRKAG